MQLNLPRACKNRSGVKRMTEGLHAAKAASCCVSQRPPQLQPWLPTTGRKSLASQVGLCLLRLLRCLQELYSHLEAFSDWHAARSR